MLAAVFLFGQWVAISHAGEYGDTFHHHGEKVCEFALAVDRDDDILLPDAPLLPLPEAGPARETPPQAGPLHRAATFRATARAPPALHD